MAKLNEEQQAMADRVQAVITAKHPDGQFKHSKEDCRAFVVGCVLDLGLPMVPQLEGVFVRFLAQIGIPEGASESDIVDGVRDYFSNNPLNPALLAEMQAIAHSQGIPIRDDFQREEAAREHVSKLMSSGQLEGSRAPQAEAEKKAPPKLKKGLS